MSNTAITNKEMKELLKEFSDAHQKRFDAIDKQQNAHSKHLALHSKMFQSVVKRLKSMGTQVSSIDSDVRAIKDVHADHYAELVDRMENIEEKQDYLLFNPKIKQLDIRVKKLELARHGKGR